MQDAYAAGLTLGNLSAVYYRIGRYEKMIQICEAQLEFTRQTGDRSGEANALWNMGQAFEKLGRRADAVAVAQQAYQIYQEIDSPQQANAQSTLQRWTTEAGQDA